MGRESGTDNPWDAKISAAAAAAAILSAHLFSERHGDRAVLSPFSRFVRVPGQTTASDGNAASPAIDAQRPCSKESKSCVYTAPPRSGQHSQAPGTVDPTHMLPPVPVRQFHARRNLVVPAVPIFTPLRSESTQREEETRTMYLLFVIRGPQMEGSSFSAATERIGGWWMIWKRTSCCSWTPCSEAFSCQWIRRPPYNTLL
jgi:hypothetical protein